MSHEEIFDYSRVPAGGVDISEELKKKEVELALRERQIALREKALELLEREKAVEAKEKTLATRANTQQSAETNPRFF